MKRCLDSVIKQTYKDIEVIIINVGSKENSVNEKIDSCIENKEKIMKLYNEWKKIMINNLKKMLKDF